MSKKSGTKVSRRRNGNQLLPRVSGQYGAPMGRRNRAINPTARVRLFRVRLDSGGYDQGGAYWGFGSGYDPLFCAIGEDFEVYLRARDREAARAELVGHHPGITFYR